MPKSITDETLPGWSFSYDWYPDGVCEVTGVHEDGRSVSQRGGDLETTLAQCKIDARNRGDKMNRDELEKARDRVAAQLSIISAHSHCGEDARRELRTILQEIEIELAELDATVPLTIPSS